MNKQWIDEYLAGLGPVELLQEARNLATKLDGDQIQDMYQSDMDAAGYFKPILQTQYEEDVPSDLVVLDVKPADWAPGPVHDAIMAAKWYQVGDVLLVSSAAIDDAGDTDPRDAGVDLSKLEKVDRVDDVLKRFDEEVYYHA